MEVDVLLDRGLRLWQRAWGLRGHSGNTVAVQCAFHFTPTTDGDERHQARTVHRAARKIREGRQAAGRYQQEDES